MKAPAQRQISNDALQPENAASDQAHAAGKTPRPDSALDLSHRVADQSALHHMVNASPVVQRQKALKQLATPRQTQRQPDSAPAPKDGTAIQRQPDSDLPDDLRSGIEALSGVAMDGVRVHRNASAPAQVNAHAFAQADAIHLAPGQDRHLPHEAWHVVQQRQGRVMPTMSLADGTAVNDDPALEREADQMGAAALQRTAANRETQTSLVRQNRAIRQYVLTSGQVMQRNLDEAHLRELQDLEKEMAKGPDEALRKRAAALYRANPSESERDRITRLVAAFSKPKRSAAQDRAAQEKRRVDEEDRRQFSDAFPEWAKATIELENRCRHIASQTRQQPPDARQISLEADPGREAVRARGEPTVVPRFVHRITALSGLSYWVALLDQLRAAPATPAVHIIEIQPLEGAPIHITLSSHNSDYGRDTKPRPWIPDFFVHDARAQLYMHPESGIQQDSPSDNPGLEQQLQTGGDSLTVSYKSFSSKLGLIKQAHKVSDAKIAHWMLLFIMSPTIAPSVIRRECPGLIDHQRNVMVELVATWMLAEPARAMSAMLSGIVQLEAIEAGQRTFDEALNDTHPMAFIGSESRGRDSDARMRKPEGIGKLPPNKYTKRLVDQIRPDRIRAELIEMIAFYVEEVQHRLEPPLTGKDDTSDTAAAAASTQDTTKDQSNNATAY